MRVRRRVGLVVVAALLVLPLALFTSVASSDRGLSGTISDRVDELTSETAAAPPEGAGRLTVSSSSRARYWREAGDVFGERPGKGTGAGTFYVSRLRYRKDELVAQHAHGYVPQTMSDLGVVGLVLSGLPPARLDRLRAARHRARAAAAPPPRAARADRVDGRADRAARPGDRRDGLRRSSRPSTGPGSSPA